MIHSVRELSPHAHLLAVSCLEPAWQAEQSHLGYGPMEPVEQSHLTRQLHGAWRVTSELKHPPQHNLIHDPADSSNPRTPTCFDNTIDAEGRW
jgi:hypothetical protein